MTFKLGQVLIHKPTGDRYFFREAYTAGKTHPAGARVTKVDGYHSSTSGLPLDELEAAPNRDHRKGFDLKEEMAPRLHGWIPWESIEPYDLNQMTQNIAACAGWSVWNDIGYMKTPGDPHPVWTRYFLQGTQGGAMTGEAYALCWGRIGTWEADLALSAAVVERAKAFRAAPSSVEANADLCSAVEALEAAKTRYVSRPTAWKVAICKHEVIDTGTPERKMRGWHPAHCAKCGIDLSVDSSD